MRKFVSITLTNLIWRLWTFVLIIFSLFDCVVANVGSVMPSIKWDGKNELWEMREEVIAVYFGTMSHLEVDVREAQNGTTKYPISLLKIEVSSTKEKGMSIILINLNVFGGRNRTLGVTAYKDTSQTQ